MTDPQHLPLELTDTPGDQDVMILQESRLKLRRLGSGGRPHAGDGLAAIFLGSYRLEIHGPKSLSVSTAHAPVPLEPGIETLLEDGLESRLESEEHMGGNGGGLGMPLTPLLLESLPGEEVGVPRMDEPRIDALQNRAANGHRGDPRQGTQTLLGTCETSIDPPIITRYLHAT